MGEKSVMAFAPALVPVTFRPLAASPPFAGRFAPFGRETHFRAVLGGEDAVEYWLWLPVVADGVSERHVDARPFAAVAASPVSLIVNRLNAPARPSKLNADPAVSFPQPLHRFLDKVRRADKHNVHLSARLPYQLNFAITSGCRRRLGTALRVVIAHSSPLLILVVMPASLAASFRRRSSTSREQTARAASTIFP
jgi:hypothetical protein